MKMLNLFFLLALFAFPAMADDYKPDDVIAMNLTTEGWVSTKTAKVTLNVNASVSAAQAGSTRADMMKAVSALGGGEWRITSFTHAQSSAGLDDWSAQFENRLPEAELSGLNEKVKKASRPGMQISVLNIDFTPTLAETEGVQSSLRKTLMEMANAELKNVQAAFPDRGYRISSINFNGGGVVGGVPPMMMRGGMAKTMMADAVSESAPQQGLEAAQKLTLTAYVTFSAVSPLAPAGAK